MALPYLALGYFGRRFMLFTYLAFPLCICNVVVAPLLCHALHWFAFLALLCFVFPAICHVAYIILLSLFCLGTCLEEYYESPGSERRVSSVAKHCSYIIRPGSVGSRVVMWLDSINIPANNFVTVDLMAVSGRLIRQYRLASNFSGVSRVYDGLNRGNWFEIEKSANASFDLKFKTYTRGKYQTEV
jgi:hypothetical protein